MLGKLLVSSSVLSICFDSLVAMHGSAMSPAILERKMRPASCTWPMAKGREEKVVKADWWTADEKRTSLTSCAYTAGSRWKE